MDMAQDPSDPSSSGWRSAGVAISIPTILAACILVGVVLGRVVDRWLGTFPLLTLVGLVLGMAAGIREMLRLLRKIKTDE